MTIPNQPPNMFKKFAIEYVDPATLKPNPKSPRKHSPQQIRKIAKSIEAFGLIVPIVIGCDDMIYGGHACVDAAIKLGMPEVPIVRADHLSKHELNVLMLALNKLPELSSWDENKLGDLFLELSNPEFDLDIELTGFHIAEIDLRIEGINDNASDKSDELPDLPPSEPITKIGDLWQLGPHRLLCGNSLEKSIYEILLNGTSADIVFTDPPYNVRIDNYVSGFGATKHREFAMASGEMSKDEFKEFLAKLCRLFVEFSTIGSLHFICMDWRHLYELLDAGALTYKELKNICVWAKDYGSMGSLYRSQHEMICVFKNGSSPHRNNVMLGKHGRYRTNVWNFPRPNSISRNGDDDALMRLHPTVKPVKLVSDAILDASARGDIVLDPFLGSGTTLMAAERVGRICYGIELDPLYCDLIIRRWQNYCGEEAIHLASGQTFNAIEALGE